MDGYVLIDKPAGWTSFDVVAKVRSELRTQLRARGSEQKARVGHAGTLDPFATGLLIVLVGKATKQQDSFMKQDKTYEAEICLGATSTTGDPEGEITVVDGATAPSDEQLQAVLWSFVGEITQVPPIYSAIKVNGQRAYDLARAGKPVELKSRQVTIYSINDVSYSFPNVRFTVRVSSGTYIRSLAADIGKALGCGAYVTALRRTKIAAYDVADAISLPTENKKLDKITLM